MTRAAATQPRHFTARSGARSSALLRNSDSSAANSPPARAARHGVTTQQAAQARHAPCNSRVVRLTCTAPHAHSLSKPTWDANDGSSHTHFGSSHVLSPAGRAIRLFSSSRTYAHTTEHAHAPELQGTDGGVPALPTGRSRCGPAGTPSAARSDSDSPAAAAPRTRQHEHGHIPTAHDTDWRLTVSWTWSGRNACFLSA